MTLKGKPYRRRQPQPPSLAPPRLVPPREPPRLPLCHGGSVSRSPAYCLVLIPPPGPGLGGCEEETRAPACAGNGKPPARPPRGHGRRGRPPAEAEPRAAGRGHTPLSRRRPSATGRRGCSFSLRGPDSCSWWGRGRATPRRARPPPAVTRGFTRPAERGPGRHARRDPQVYQAPPPPGGRASPVVPRLPHPHRYPLPGLRTPSPHLLHAEIESQPHPPQPAGNIQVLPPSPSAEPGKFGSRSRAGPTPGPARPKHGLAPLYLAGASGPPWLAAPWPGPTLPPPRRRRPGWGGGVGAAAARGAEAAPPRGRERRGEGTGGGGEGAAHLRHCNARGRRVILSRTETGSGAARRRGLRGGGAGAKKNGSRPALPRSPSGGRRPGGSLGETWRAGALPTPTPQPPGTGSDRAPLRAEASIRKQVAGGGREPPARTQRKRSRRPSPPEETPPQPSAAPNRGASGT